MDIDWIIDNVNECDYVDYKKELKIHSSDEDTNDFIMDIIAFANSPVGEEKFIIYGIEVEKTTRTKNIVGINQSDFKDGASYQQLIASNVDPQVNFELLFIDYKNQKLGVFHIFNCTDPIYFASSNRNTLSHKKDIREGDFWLRVSDHKVKGGRREHEIIMRVKNAKKEIDESKVNVYFKNAKSGEMVIDTVGIYEKPHELATQRIMSCLKEIEEIKKHRDQVQNSRISQISNIPYIINNDPFSIKQYEDMDELELYDALSQVKKDYEIDDRHFLFEVRGTKLELYVTNDNIEFIDDVTIRIQIPNITGLDITVEETRLPDHERHNLVSIMEMRERDERKRMEAKIIQHNPWIIERCKDKLRHGIEEDIFPLPPRIAINNCLSGRNIDFIVSISAKNLKHPIIRTLTIKVKDRQVGEDELIKKNDTAY
ncbi:MAG: Divergent AAA domain protein [Methanomassiliicoccales archaeon PtaU1.Bin124]|nr:MAG: Divergent AAA domain protein [Methanomassiliicoccales archaeon PtaU1.Bin124]